MIVVAGFWEFGWFAPINEADLWQFPCKEFDVNVLVMIPVTGIKSKIIELSGLQTALDNYSSLTPVFVDEQAETLLPEFEHPEDVLYITGKSGFSPYKSVVDNCLSVRIPTPKNGGRLWAHQAICLVLYDRMMKKW